MSEKPKVPFRKDRFNDDTGMVLISPDGSRIPLDADVPIDAEEKASAKDTKAEPIKDQAA